MKVVVNRDNCIGCGACEALYPDVFQIDDEGLSTVISNENLDEEKMHQYRTFMEHDCEAAIFMFGRSETTEKEGSYNMTGHYSRGVYQEFKIALELGCVIIPIGATGYEAKVIWDEVKKNINNYPYLSKKVDILGISKDADLLTKTVISVLNESSKHNRVYHKKN